MSETLNVDDARLLTAAELQAVNLTLHPAITALSRRDLQALARRLREARNRARTIGSQQRREIRGKSEPRGAAPARDDTGTNAKEQVLADALRRVTERLQHGAEASGPAPDAEASITVPPISAAGSGHVPSGGPPAVKPSKKASVARPTAKKAVAKPSKLPTLRSDPREVGRVTKSVASAQARRDSKPR